jgi:hypothetical protein
MGALSVEQALADEAEILASPEMQPLAKNLRQIAEEIAARHDTPRARTSKNADAHDGEPTGPDEIERRNEFYRSLNRLNRAALCLSGGGIRSATFCLGVIQALAAYDVRNGMPNRDENCLGRPENSLLGRFHYLSTVSGGGYIGSWLSSWRAVDDFPKVWRELTSRPAGPDVEPAEVSWLRAYSNYLTPRVGVGSADSWTAVAIYARNLLLNWLVIIPVLCLVLFILKFVAATSVGVARGHDDWWLISIVGLIGAASLVAIAIYARNLLLNWVVVIPLLCLAPFILKVAAAISGVARGHDGWWLISIVGLIGAASLVRAQAFTTAHRPVRREPQPDPLPGQEPVPSPNDVDQRAFVKHDLPWSVLSAIGATIFFCSRPGTIWVENSGRDFVLIVLAIVGALLFAVGWIAGRPVRRSRQDFALWVASGLVYGALVGLGAYLFTLLVPYTDAHRDLTLSAPIIFGIPWVLVSQLAAEMIFVGLVSYEIDSDSDREWLGRAAGWVIVAAIGWAATAFLSIGVGYLVVRGDSLWPHLGHYIAALGGMSGVATALIGKSGKTSATTDDNDPSWTGYFLNLLVSIAGPVFVAALIVGISIALDQLMFGDTFLHVLNAVNPTITGAPTIEGIVFLIVVGAIVAIGVGVVASKNVNINRFSLHAVYRNRLVRGYLGASRQGRNPDRFTGFDAEDNVRVHTLWPPKATSDGQNTHGLFHVINISLNVVESRRLAWQERKAEPFTVSPKHCGSAFKGFRPSCEYAGPGGISLGTAMAISGAAVSPNMGYYSSPSISLLLALFNVRLGWWLGNPGSQGETSYATEGPSFAIKPLIGEALGLTTDDRPYVYLSDGGHFEDLGLYEMVRRRCKFIVVVDAGEDARLEFADLGNAVRKIYIDLGIRIRFNGLQSMRNRPPDSDQQRVDIPYHAIGVIEYGAADGAERDGIILYIKPALHGTEAAGIASYAASHPTFPHETTTDQWFTESQFESYRSLGFEITDHILKTENIAVSLPGQPKATLKQRLAELSKTTLAGQAVQAPKRDCQPAAADSKHTAERQIAR